MFYCALFGVPFTIMGLAILLCTVLPRKKCKTQLNGRCTGYQRVYGVRGGRIYAPMFEFYFNGELYSTTSRSSIRDRDLPRYQPGTMHPVWIDENNPLTLISNLSYSYKETVYLICSGVFFFQGLSLTLIGIIFGIIFKLL